MAAEGPRIVGDLELRDRASPVLRDFEANLAGVSGRFGEFANIGRMVLTGFMRLEIASDALQNAQSRLGIAQENLNRAIARYGPGSEQAARAQQELEISTRSLDIAQNRQAIRMAFLAGTILPEAIGMVYQMVRGMTALTTATQVATAATHAFTTAKLIGIGVATFGVGAAVGLAGGLAAAGAFQGMNVYGDVNVSNPANLADDIMGRQPARVERR